MGVTHTPKKWEAMGTPSTNVNWLFLNFGLPSSGLPLSRPQEGTTLLGSRFSILASPFKIVVPSSSNFQKHHSNRIKLHQTKISFGCEFHRIPHDFLPLQHGIFQLHVPGPQRRKVTPEPTASRSWWKSYHSYEAMNMMNYSYRVIDSL